MVDTDDVAEDLARGGEADLPALVRRLASALARAQERLDACREEEEP